MPVRRWTWSWLLPACWLAMASPHAAEGASPLRVMAFNVRVPADTDGNRWEARRDLLLQTIRDAAPDVVGTQELVAGQGEAIARGVPGYGWFGVGRKGDGDPRDEHMGVFYRSASLRLVEAGNFWLSDTPAVPGSAGWGNLYPRMVTWGLFERRTDGRRFYLLDTHLPYREQDGPVRERAAGAIGRWVAALPAEVPVVLVGDFNDVPGSATHRLLTRTLHDAWMQAREREGPDGTFHGFTGEPGPRIDWVLQRGLHPVRVRTLVDHADGRYPSDHFPVLVEFE